MTAKNPEHNPDHQTSDHIAIFGANADIARAMARLWAVRGARLCLFSRDKKALARLAKDLTLRGASFVATEGFEARNFASHDKLLAHAHKALGGLRVVVLAQGVLPNQKTAEKNFEQARIAWETNFLSVVSLAHAASARMEKKGGVISVFGSVAGDRGRASNYVYGSGKGAVALFLQGLRHRLARAGSPLCIQTLKPGFVSTKMTASFRKGALWSSPEHVARVILRAIDSKREQLYVPWLWVAIMAIIRNIPEKIFKRLPL